MQIYTNFESNSQQIRIELSVISCCFRCKFTQILKAIHNRADDTERMLKVVSDANLHKFWMWLTALLLTYLCVFAAEYCTQCPEQAGPGLQPKKPGTPKRVGLFRAVCYGIPASTAFSWGSKGDYLIAQFFHKFLNHPWIIYQIQTEGIVNLAVEKQLLFVFLLIFL